MATEVELGTKLWEIEQQRKKLAKIDQELKDEYQAAANQLQDYLLEEGKGSTGHIQGVGEFRFVEKSYLSVNKANMPGLISYLKTTPDAHLVKEVVEAPTLKTYLQQRHEELVMGMLESPGQVEAIETTCGVEPGLLTPAELASKFLELSLGASTFTETKLSHVKKGK